MILYFLKKHFGDTEKLVTPITPLHIETPEEELRQLFTCDDFKSDYRILNKEVRKLGYNIPPLVNAHTGLSPTMRVFGTAVNHEFGEVEDGHFHCRRRNFSREAYASWLRNIRQPQPLRGSLSKEAVRDRVGP